MIYDEHVLRWMRHYVEVEKVSSLDDNMAMLSRRVLVHMKILR